MEKYLESFNLHNQTIVIAVSTGVDSIVLLDCFLKIKDKNNLQLIVAHVNHGKREASITEEKFLVEYCKNKNIICEVSHLNKNEIHDNFQDYARKYRYNFFLEVLEKYQAKYLALAHHANDNIETILMRIIRGSSLEGYGGMLKETDFHGHTIIRPFLEASKEEITAYAQSNSLQYFEDESNSSSIYTRNRIRKTIVPTIIEENANAYSKFYEFASNIHQASDFINYARDQFIKEHVQVFSDHLMFSINEFLSNHQYLQKEILFELLKSHQLSRKNIEELLKIINSPKANIISDIKKEFSVVKEYDNFIILNYLHAPKGVDILIDSLGTYKINDTIDIIVTQKLSNNVTNSNELWYNTNMLPLRVRTRRDGDKIKLSSGYKKVKDYLIDLKVGLLERSEVLLLVDKDDQVLAVLGYAKSEILKAVKINDIIIKWRKK